MLEEGAEGELMTAVPRDVLLHHELAFAEEAPGLFEPGLDLRQSICAPSLRLRVVDEMLFDRGLDRDRVRNWKTSELACLAWGPGARNGNPAIRGTSVGVALVPGPLDAGP